MCIKGFFCFIIVALFVSQHEVARAQLKNAHWISASGSTDSVCLIFKKAFNTYRTIKSATISITAHGIYEATINNQRIGKAYFTPGWTNYNKRLQYQSYVVTGLKAGKNMLQITVNGGWYSGVFGEEMKSGWYGHKPGLLVQLDITYMDGTRQIICSDSSWLCGSGPIKYADFYNGEIQDERIAAGNWRKAAVDTYPKTNLIPTIAEPVTKQENFKPKRIFKDPKGETIIDFGQNLAGWVRLYAKGETGDTITISHAELLDQQGNFYTGNLRDAKATDIYILNGKRELLEPHFTYHGFRYAKVTGFTPTQTNCMAIAVHSNLRHTGTFSCSNPLLNQLQHNIEWSLNSNFVDIPTDCPQRSERFGWTGDAQVFCATASFNRYTLDFYKKWVADLASGQGTNGAVPHMIPDFEQQKDTVKQGYAGWGDAATIMPWTLYQVYGDKSILNMQYNSMKAWVDYINSQSRDNLWKANGYGDWYALGSKTGLPFIDQCFWAHSTQLLINAARVLHKSDDITYYEDRLKTIKAAFQENYGGKDTTQTACVLELQFDMLPDSNRQKAADKLAKLIHKNDNHLATGFLGTPYLLSVLTKYGYTKLAYTLLLQKTCPSWLYPVTKGATTIWERWDAIRPYGTIQQCSFNHYAYGAVGQWLYETIAGIQPTSPGYKSVLIESHIGGGLTWVKSSYQSKYGLIISDWKIKDRQVMMDVQIPSHITAIIKVPGSRFKKVGPGKYHFTGIKIG